jgi:hypothetical protein
MDYLYGAGSGLSWANTYLLVRNERPFYCPPEKMALNNQNYVDIALEKYERNTQEYQRIGEYPTTALVMALFDGLQTTFPCK